MATETTGITVDILRRIQADQAAHRQESRALQQSQVDLVRLIQRLDARISDVERRVTDTKADLETMFRMELIGQLAHQETRVERMLGEAIAGVDERLVGMEARRAGLIESKV